MMSYFWGLIGGLMIGTAGAILLLGAGRIMGASGMIGAVVDSSAKGSERSERLAFLAGLVGLPALAFVIFGAGPTHLSTNIAVILAAGLCVGLGTRLANGCTSGHGVCGISRLSGRGMAATVLYLLAGFLSVYIFRHILGAI